MLSQEGIKHIKSMLKTVPSSGSLGVVGIPGDTALKSGAVAFDKLVIMSSCIEWLRLADRNNEIKQLLAELDWLTEKQILLQPTFMECFNLGIASRSQRRHISGVDEWMQATDSLVNEGSSGRVALFISRIYLDVRDFCSGAPIILPDLNAVSIADLAGYEAAGTGATSRKEKVLEVVLHSIPHCCPN
jgi:hypothetical protein